MFTSNVPAGVTPVVAIVRVEATGALPSVIDDGLNEQVAPAGRPVQLVGEKLIVPVKPFDGVIVTVEVAEAPEEIDAGENAVAAILKSAMAAVFNRP